MEINSFLPLLFFLKKKNSEIDLSLFFSLLNNIIMQQDGLRLLAIENLRRGVYKKAEKQFLDRIFSNNVPTDINIANDATCIFTRFILNRLFVRDEKTDDPVFPIKDDPCAASQMERDLMVLSHRYPNVTTINSSKDVPIDTLSDIRIGVEQMKKAIKTTKIPSGPAKFSLDKQQIVGPLFRIPDVNSLGRKYPGELAAIVVLHIRYLYLGMKNLALCTDYRSRKLSPKDGAEAFASAFNHYFDTYWSAFPDLERRFGSRGSFFNEQNWSQNVTLYVNPPFDETLCDRMVTKIVESEWIGPTQNIEFTLPNWPDFRALERLKKMDGVMETRIIEKSATCFIDPIDNRKEVCPCDIIIIETRGPLSEIEETEKTKSDLSYIEQTKTYDSQSESKKRKHDSPEEFYTKKAKDRNEGSSTVHAPHTRRLLNTVKRGLLSRYTKSHTSNTKINVLDLGCGHGQDVRKLLQELPKMETVTFADQCADALKECKHRVEETKGFPKSTFVEIDFTTNGFTSAFQNKTYDLVSAQFCVHYACESEDSMRSLCRQVSEILRPGGVFMGVTLDMERVMRHFPYYHSDLFSIVQDKDVPNRYLITIGDAVSCSEYLVDKSLFTLCCAESGLYGNIESLDESIVNQSKNERELCSLYTTFWFRKE